MYKQFGFLTSLLFGLFLCVGPIEDAEAKRFGGGASFGSRASHNSVYKRQAAAPVAAPSASQAQAMARNQSVREGLSRRGGLMGMLGGLAIGGLLGSLLFGGAFENIKFLDILMFAGIAYMLFRLLAARKQASTPQPAYTRSAEPASPRGASDYAPPASVTPPAAPLADSGDWFRGGLKNDDAAVAQDFNQASVPAGFDQAGFLAGARIAFTDLQKAWDARDLAAVRRLTTDGMYVEIESRIKEIDADNRTTVLKLEAELLEAREVGDQLEAVVLFDGILREANDDQARQVREVWHFVKPRNAQQPTWFLDGLQQLED